MVFTTSISFREFSIELQYFQKVNPNFPHLECGLGLVPHSWRMEQSWSDGVLFWTKVRKAPWLPPLNLSLWSCSLREASCQITRNGPHVITCTTVMSVFLTPWGNLSSRPSSPRFLFQLVFPVCSFFNFLLETSLSNGFLSTEYKLEARAIFSSEELLWYMN